MVPESFSLPGYEVVELLGRGATGEVWLARDLSSGDPVALQRVVVDRLDRLDQARRDAAVLAEVAHPHVARPRAVLPRPGEIVLVVDHPPGGSLAALLAARGRLTAGEVVTTAAPLAQALAAVHARGLTHGDVTPASVLFTGDGGPLLAGFGVARLLGERVSPGDYADPAGVAPGAPASDVYGLAAVCLVALTGAPPRPAAGGVTGVDDRPGSTPSPSGVLAEALRAALDPDPAGRPSAAEFAVRLYDACPAAPVRLAARLAGPKLGSAPGSAGMAGTAPRSAGSAPASAGSAEQVVERPRPDVHPVPDDGAVAEGRHRVAGRLPRPAAAALAAVAVVTSLALAVAAGLVWARAGEPRVAALEPPAATAPPAVRAPPTAPAPPTARRPAEPAASSSPGSPSPAAATDWAAVLSALYAVRSEAFAGPDARRLDEVYAPGSPDLAANRRLVRALVEAGARAPDVRVEVISATPLPAGADSSGGTVTLRVVDRLAPYTVVTGTTARRRPGRAPQTVRVRLERAAKGWRIGRTTLASAG